MTPPLAAPATAAPAPRQASLGTPAQGFVDRMPGLAHGIRQRVTRPRQEAPLTDRRQLPLNW